MFAYGKLLNGTDTIGEVHEMFEHKLDGKKLEINYSKMATFG